MRTTLVALAILIPVLAGCVEAGKEATISPSQSLPTDSASDTGAIAGIVTNDELTPIPDARVSVPSLNRSVRTVVDGTFLLEAVPPGEHKLVIEAIGHNSLGGTVSVIVGETASVKYALVPQEIEIPYTELHILTGFTVCVASLIYFTYTVDVAGCEGQKQTLEVPVQDSWRYGVLEMAWQGQTSMHFISDTNNNCGYGNESTESCFYWKIGRSPMRMDAKPNDPAYVQWKMLYPSEGFGWVTAGLDAGFLQQEIDGAPTCDLSYQVYGGYSADCGGVGAGYPGYRFDLYASVFHYEVPEDPASYSGQPPS